MNETPVRVLLVGSMAASLLEPSDDFGPFDVTACGIDEVWQRMGEHPFDAMVVAGDWTGWTRCASEVAVLVVVDTLIASDALRCLQAGAQDVVTTEEHADASWPRRVRAAVERQRVRAATRQAFATDVHTGLPHVGQLIEHMSHLLALREREPSPMALLVLRIEGLATTTARLGGEAAGALRRKIAVRLRAGVRGSDVVASVSDDSFAVLLSQIDSPGDADRVGRKLLTALGETFKVGGQDVAVATALGIAATPADGSQPMRA